MVLDPSSDQSDASAPNALNSSAIVGARSDQRMNATLNSEIIFSEDTADESDSDTNSAEGSDYYEPISAIDDEESDEAGSEDETYSSDPHSHHLPNGCRVVNAVSSLNLNDDVERRCSDEEEEERRREASDLEIRMAFREDETRRNAPLSPENATRIMEAMRGISFGGSAPDWTRIVSEDRWNDQLRRLRQTPNSLNNF